MAALNQKDGESKFTLRLGMKMSALSQNQQLYHLSATLPCSRWEH